MVELIRDAVSEYADDNGWVEYATKNYNTPKGKASVSDYYEAYRKLVLI